MTTNNNLRLPKSSTKLDIANVDSINVKILQETHYYLSAFDIDQDAYYFISDYENNNCGEAQIFDTYADAQKWVDECQSGIYILSHDEADRPSYYIVK